MMRATVLLLTAAAAAAAPHKITVCASGCTHSNLQTALQAAATYQDTTACVDTIVEARAGETFTGEFVLPARSCGRYIRLRSSRLAELPAGRRVGPADAALMPKLISPPGSPVATLVTAEGGPTAYWAIEGIEITQPDLGSTTKYVLAGIGFNSNLEDRVSKLPHHVLVDRSYLHGVPMKEGPVRCLAVHGRNVWITNSYLADCKSGNTDAQAIWAGGALGPMVVTNSYLEASSENFMAGGGNAVGNSAIAVKGYAQRDLRFTGNHLAKRAEWRKTTAAGVPTRICMIGEWQQDTLTGQWYSCTDGSGVWTPSATAPLGFVVKNLFELKDGQGVLLYGNVIERVWQAGQAGAAILINQSGDYVHNTNVRDVRIAANRIEYANAGLAMGNLNYLISPPGTTVTSGVRLEDNLFANMGAPYLRADGGNSSRFFMSSRSQDIVYRHNTLYNFPGAGAGSYSAIGSNDDGRPSLGGMNYIGENVFDRPFTGLYYLWSGGGNTHCFFRNVLTGFDGAGDIRLNVFAGSGSVGDSCTGGSGPVFPAGTVLSADIGSILEDPVGGNYRIDSSLTAARGTSFDGRDLGADIDLVEWATAAGRSGEPNPFLDFRVRGHRAASNAAEVFFTAPTMETCTAAASLNPLLTPAAGTSTVSRTGRSAVAAVTGLAANTVYHYRLTCGGWSQRGTLRTRP